MITLGLLLWLWVSSFFTSMALFILIHIKEIISHPTLLLLILKVFAASYLTTIGYTYAIGAACMFVVGGLTSLYYKSTAPLINMVKNLHRSPIFMVWILSTAQAWITTQAVGQTLWSIRFLSRWARKGWKWIFPSIGNFFFWVMRKALLLSHDFGMFGFLFNLIPDFGLRKAANTMFRILLSLSWNVYLELATAIWHTFDVFKNKSGRVSWVFYLMARFAQPLLGLGANLGSQVSAQFNAASAKVFGESGEGEDNTLYSLISLLLAGTTAERVWLRGFNARIQAVTGFARLFQLFQEFFEKFSPDGTLARFKSWTHEATGILNNKPTSFTKDFKARITRLCDEARVLREIYAAGDRSVKHQVAPMFLSVYAEFMKFYESNRTRIKELSERMEPVVVFSGHKARTGKSELAKKLNRFMAERMAGVPYDQGASDLIYYYGKNTNHRMDGISSAHRILNMDDMMMATDVTAKRADVELFCQAASKDPWYPDIAEMTQKRTPFSPEFVNGNTNTLIHPGSKLGVEDTNAFLGRIDFYYEVPQFTGPRKDETALSDFTTVTIIYKRGKPCKETVSVPDFFWMVWECYVQKRRQFHSRDEVWKKDSRLLAQHRLANPKLWGESQAAPPPPPPAKLDGEVDVEDVSAWDDPNYNRIVERDDIPPPYKTFHSYLRQLRDSAPDIAWKILCISTAILGVYLLVRWLRGYFSKEGDGSVEISGERSSYEKKRRPPRQKPRIVKGEADSYAKPERVPKRKQRIIGEVSIDDTSEAILDKYLENFVYVRILTDEGAYRQSAQALRDYTILLNTHALLGTDDDTKIVLWRYNVSIPVFLSDCERIDFGMDRTVLIHKKFGGFKDMIKHFIKDADLPLSRGMIDQPIQVIGRNCTKTDKHGDCALVIRLADFFFCHRSEVTIENSFAGRDITFVDDYFTAPVNTKPSVCGSLYVRLDSREQRKFVGMHMGSIRPGEAGFTPITQELLYSALSLDPDRKDPDVVFQGETGLEWSEDPEDNALARAQIKPGFALLGSVKSGAHLHSLSSIKPSVLQQFLSPTTIPAHRHDWFDGGELVHPSDYFFGKGEQPCLVAMKVIRPCYDQMMSRLPKPNLRLAPVLSLEESLNGKVRTMLHPLRVKTSGGIRAQKSKLCKVGKIPYIKTDVTEHGTQLRLSRAGHKDLYEQLEIFKQRFPSRVAKDAQKDERYPLEKERKYRVVSTDDVADLILFRMYLGTFLDVLRRQQPFGSSQVGIDATGPNFSVLYEFLARYGHKAMALDAKAWDFVLPFEFLMAGIEFILLWFERTYDPSEEDQKIRRNLLEKYLFHLHVFGKTLYGRCGGIFSGKPDTAEMNGLVLELLWRVMFRIMCPGKLYDNHVRAAFYGDDCIGTVRDVPEFNQMTFAKCGKELFDMTWTTADKETPNVPYEELDTASFISRRFRDLNGTKVGAMDVDDIMEIPLWCRGSTPVEQREVTVQNVDAALRELFLHGREVFQEKKELFARFCMKLSLPVSQLTYDGLAVEWKNKC